MAWRGAGPQCTRQQLNKQRTDVVTPLSHLASLSTKRFLLTQQFFGFWLLIILAQTVLRRLRSGQDEYQITVSTLKLRQCPSCTHRKLEFLRITVSTILRSVAVDSIVYHLKPLLADASVKWTRDAGTNGWYSAKIMKRQLWLPRDVNM